LRLRRLAAHGAIASVAAAATACGAASAPNSPAPTPSPSSSSSVSHSLAQPSAQPSPSASATTAPVPPVHVSAFSYVDGGIVRGATDRKRISLVFTGGSHAEGARTILDALAKRQLKASFFLTGDFIRLYPRLVGRMVREGHYVGPHSDKHLLYCSWDTKQTLVTRKQFLSDLNANLSKLQAHGVDPAQTRYFIPPFEWWNNDISRWAGEKGRAVVGFTRGSGSELDWMPDSHPNFVASNEIRRRILQYESAQPKGLNGFLMIMHLGTGPERTDKFHPYIPSILDTLINRGYRFKRVDRLLSAALPGTTP
jgi:endoglucanase